MYLIQLLQFVLAGFIVAEIQSLTSRDTRLNELQIINAGVPIISEYTPHSKAAFPTQVPGTLTLRNDVLQVEKWTAASLYPKFLIAMANTGLFGLCISYSCPDVLDSVFTCQPGGTRGSDRKRGHLPSSHFHSPPQYCWAHQQHDHTFLSSDLASACRKHQQWRHKKETEQGVNE